MQTASLTFGGIDSRWADLITRRPRVLDLDLSARSSGALRRRRNVPPEKVVRPNPLQWLRYVYVGTVPAKNHAWVLYDATRPTWVLRHALRYLALVAPLIILVMIFLPAPLGLRAMCCVPGPAPNASRYERSLALYAQTAANGQMHCSSG